MQPNKYPQSPDQIRYKTCPDIRMCVPKTKKRQDRGLAAVSSPLSRGPHLLVWQTEVISLSLKLLYTGKKQRKSHFAYWLLLFDSTVSDTQTRTIFHTRVCCLFNGIHELSVLYWDIWKHLCIHDKIILKSVVAPWNVCTWIDYKI